VVPPLEKPGYTRRALWADGLTVVISSGDRATEQESCKVVTDESPLLQTLWQYALRFRIERVNGIVSGLYEDSATPEAARTPHLVMAWHRSCDTRECPCKLLACASLVDLIAGAALATPRWALRWLHGVHK